MVERSFRGYARTFVGILSFAIGLPGGAALADGACCLEGGCVDVEDEMQCGSLGGFYLEGASCDADGCGVGACCFEQSCATSEAYPCIAAGREFAGAGTSCLDDPCDAGVGACCFDAGACDDISPEACDELGGTWLGAGTTCAGGQCDAGVCCRPGACDDSVAFVCAAEGGVFIAGAECAGSGCEVTNGCAADALYGQPRQSTNGFTAYVSDDDVGPQRLDRYTGVAGTIERLRWWGFDLLFDERTLDFDPCVETNPEFRITFRADDGGQPGEIVCEHVAVVPPVATGIMYDKDVELQEYEFVLPGGCVLPTGWVSVVGLGDESCHFYWLGGTGGDGTSFCNGCGADDAGDLSFCLGGTFGGLFGACCNLSTAECVSEVEIVDCIAIDQRFEPGVACDELDPPCLPTTGACCFDDAQPCNILLPDECVAQGGTYLGGDTDCISCPVLGTCCFVSFDTCFFMTEQECLNENGTFLFGDVECDACPALPACDDDVLFGQPPTDPDGFVAGTSEGPFERFERFTGLLGAIDAVTWWGVDLDHIEGTNAFQECEEPDPTFIITFYEDAGGAPGAAVHTYELLATRTPVGILYLGTELNEYRVTLPQPCALTDGWVSIVGLGDEECLFLWMNSDEGSGGSWCEGCNVQNPGNELAICLEGSVGGVSGACCFVEAGRCDDGIDIAECVAAGGRFDAETTCVDLEPACGVVVGACCFDDATCSIETQPDCAAAGGSWLGASTICAHCPCLTPCPAGADQEGEPVCGPGYMDSFNSGCDTGAAIFAPISLGQTICGTSGVFEAAGGALVPENDWYEIEVSRPMELFWSIDAEFTAGAAIRDASGGCPGEQIAGMAATPCSDLTVSAQVEPGIYWLGVGPIGATDDATCGARYTARVLSSCTADANGDGSVDVDDLVGVLLAWGTDDPAHDLNADGNVDVDDLVMVILSWGPCGALPATKPMPPAAFPASPGVNGRVFRR